jgi:hypothetical protein
LPGRLRPTRRIGDVRRFGSFDLRDRQREAGEVAGCGGSDDRAALGALLSAGAGDAVGPDWKPGHLRRLKLGYSRAGPDSSGRSLTPRLVGGDRRGGKVGRRGAVGGGEADASGRWPVRSGDQPPELVWVVTRPRGCWRHRSRRSTRGRRGGSKLDPLKDWFCEQLAADPRIESQRLREMARRARQRGRELESLMTSCGRSVRGFAAEDVPAHDQSPG